MAEPQLTWSAAELSGVMSSWCTSSGASSRGTAKTVALLPRYVKSKALVAPRRMRAEMTTRKSPSGRDTEATDIGQCTTPSARSGITGPCADASTWDVHRPLVTSIELATMRGVDAVAADGVAEHPDDALVGQAGAGADVARLPERQVEPGHDPVELGHGDPGDFPVGVALGQTGVSLG